MSTTAEMQGGRVEPGYVTWSPPLFDMTRPPVQLFSRQLDPAPSDESTGILHPSVFARQAKWCPDGSVALAQCEDRTFRFLQLPLELLGIPADKSTPVALRTDLVQSSPILDYTWYPTATVRDPASFCFVASVRECPVKLLDASDGRLRASYRIVDHRERQIAPHSMAFNLHANRLYCGFEDAIEVFDVHRPGEGTRLHTTPSKKSRDGLKGIIAALAFAPDASTDIYAAGSLSPSAPASSNIALFSEASGEAPVMFVGAEDSAGYGVRASVSQLMFNPARPHLLYASFRRLDAIYAWDLRGDVGRPVEVLDASPISAGPHTPAPAPAPAPVHAATPTLAAGPAPGPGAAGSRSSPSSSSTKTNQRLRFDIDFGGRWLAAGDERGGISVFDLAADQQLGTASHGAENVYQSTSGTTPRRTPILHYAGHDDAVGSVAFHPLSSLVLSVSGSRHFTTEGTTSVQGPEDAQYSSDSTESDSDSEEGDGEPRSRKRGPDARGVRFRRGRRRPIALDTSVKLWGFNHGQVGQERY